MTKPEKLTIIKDRLSKLENNPKDVKCPGVIRKLRRQVRLLESRIFNDVVMSDAVENE